MENDKPTIKKYRFESLVTLLLLLAFLLVVVTGVLSFVRLNNIIYTVNSTIRPDRRLILVKEIYSDLIQAENNVRSYTLTRNEEDMVRFYQIAETTAGKMDELMNRVKKDNLIYAYLDTLDNLVETKFTILDRLLVSQDELLVKKAMDEVMQNISAEKIQEPKTEPEPNSQTQAETLTDTTTEQISPKKENFLSRLFRKKKADEETVPDTVKTTEPELVPVPVEPQAEMVTVEQIGEEVRKARLKAMAVDKVRREKEMELFSQDRAVMEKIRKLMTELEILEAQRLKENTVAAENKASEVKLIILLFGIASMFLLLLTGVIIFIYIKRNNEYRLIMKKARQEAEDLARAKERFLANMSHEIKNPMNIISGYLGQVLKTPLSPGQQEHISIVKKSADHLLRLLNNLLDLSKMQAGKLDLLESEVSPAELINDMYNWFSQAAAEKKLQLFTEISSSLPPVMMTDPVRLRQILSNLAGNAIKFTDTGSVTIRAYPGNDSGEHKTVIFEVTDTGIGIPENEMSRIFGEFEQGSSSSDKKTSGTGLGLAITSKLTELLGGNISVKSIQGKGSTFRVEVPLIQGKTLADPQAPLVIPGSDRLNGLVVLVVDDEPYNRGLIRLILGKFNCTILEAEEGRAAISIAESRKIDLILMDIRMPGMNGPDAAKEIMKISRNKGLHIPVIALSADMTQEDMAKYRRNGFDDCLLKPFEETRLLKAIINLLSEPAKKPDYDLGQLLESCQGDKTFFREMVSMFLDSTESGLTGMAELIKQEDWRNAAEMAHKISAPCKHVKAEKLYLLIKQIEKELTSNSPEKSAAATLLQAGDEFELIRKDILANLDNY
jgi:signal transduction histidine kinase/DNA-binding response OmpR family regulator